MDILPFSCPRQGHKFVRAEPIDDKRPYYCSCGRIILSTTVVDYLDPFQDKDGKRARMVRDMVAKAWAEQNYTPYINAPTFDRRLAELERGPTWWQRLFRLGSDRQCC